MRFEESTVPLSAEGCADPSAVTGFSPPTLCFLFTFLFSSFHVSCPPCSVPRQERGSPFRSPFLLSSLPSGLQEGQGGGPGAGWGGAELKRRLERASEQGAVPGFARPGAAGLPRLGRSAGCAGGAARRVRVPQPRRRAGPLAFGAAGLEALRWPSPASLCLWGRQPARRDPRGQGEENRCF